MVAGHSRLLRRGGGVMPEFDDEEYESFELDGRWQER